MRQGTIPVRRGQLITTYGPGSISIGPEGIPLLVAGLDEWFTPWPGGSTVDISKLAFSDARLEMRLGVSSFRLPPDYKAGRADSDKSNYKLAVPSYLFPRWYACGQCFRLKCFQPNDVESRVSVRGGNPKMLCSEKSEVSEHDCSKRPGRFRPVPFLAVCDRGHIQDFPFRQWVHRSAHPTCTRTMHLFGLGGAVEQTEVRCSCGARRKLTGVLDDPISDVATSTLSATLTRAEGAAAGSNAPYLCRGLKAWVGNVQEPCDRQLVGVLTSGTNVYYSDVRSSIVLPSGIEDNNSGVSQTVLDKLKPAEQIYKNIPREASEETIDSFSNVLAGITGLTSAEIRAALKYLLGVRPPELSEDTDYDERTFRQDEYRLLCSDKPVETEQLIIEPMSLNPWLSKSFKRISMVRRLRETRALVGFSRLRGASPLTLKQKKNLLWRGGESVDPAQRWLPGYFVHGEGIFFEFDPDVLARVELTHIVKDRLERSMPYRVLDKSAAFIAIHTFAHLLIRKLSFECGYGAASLRERLYVQTDSAEGMHGVMIYTAQSDSEGSMGGLVRMATSETLERIVRGALDEATWCSSDPVCREIGRDPGQGLHQLNGAAGHACCHLPETSCECFNLLLDRSLVVGDSRGVGGIFQGAGVL